ncbi:Single-stranded DNA-binding protein 1 [Gammaproteobacteria bacterium]
MPNMNKVVLIGHAGKNAELRYVASGKGVCNFSLATSEHWKDASGAKQEKTVWHNIVAWDKLGEWAGSETGIKKGDLVIIEGKIDNRSYDDKDGNKRYVSEIIAQSIQVHRARPLGSPANSEAPTASGGNAPNGDNDLPF